jgi:hypothetical protein
MNNPYLSKVIALIEGLKGWGLALVGVITAAVIVKDCLQYQQGSSQEKAEARDNIKKHLYMGGGIFFLVWFATYVVSYMQ